MRVWQHFDLCLTSNSSVSGGVSNCQKYLRLYMYMYIIHVNVLLCYMLCRSFHLVNVVLCASFCIWGGWSNAKVCGDWMLKDVLMIGCRIMHLWLRSKSCTVPESEWESLLQLLGILFGGGGGGIETKFDGEGYLFIYVLLVSFSWPAVTFLFFFVCLVKWTFFYMWAVSCASLGFEWHDFPVQEWYVVYACVGALMLCAAGALWIPNSCFYLKDSYV